MTDMIFLAAAPFLALFVCESAYHPQFLKMGPGQILKNWAVWLLMELILYWLIPWRGIGLVLFFLTAVLAGIGSYFVILFRSTPVTPADLLSLNTGVAVAGAYQFHIPANGILAILAGIAGMAASLVLTASGQLSKPAFPLCWAAAAVLILGTLGLMKARVPGRMEVYANADEKVSVIVDYAHNRMSFETLFKSVKTEYPGRRIVTVQRSVRAGTL